MTLKATTDNITTLVATKLTGALPALDASALTGIVAGPLTGASDPTVSTNPSGAGIVYENTTSGQLFICTDADTDNNTWLNVGSGSGDVWQFQGTIEGYIAGGNVVGGSAQNLIQKFLFSSNTTATNLGDIQTISYLTAGTSSSTHGYVAGGNPDRKSVV